MAESKDKVESELLAKMDDHLAVREALTLEARKKKFLALYLDLTGEKQTAVEIAAKLKNELEFFIKFICEDQAKNVPLLASLFTKEFLNELIQHNHGNFWDSKRAYRDHDFKSLGMTLRVLLETIDAFLLTLKLKSTGSKTIIISAGSSDNSEQQEPPYAASLAKENQRVLVLNVDPGFLSRPKTGFVAEEIAPFFSKCYFATLFGHITPKKGDMGSGTDYLYTVLNKIFELQRYLIKDLLTKKEKHIILQSFFQGNNISPLAYECGVTFKDQIGSNLEILGGHIGSFPVLLYSSHYFENQRGGIAAIWEVIKKHYQGIRGDFKAYQEECAMLNWGKLFPSLSELPSDALFSNSDLDKKSRHDFGVKF